ncbi:single-stranded DNA-binding protein [Bifidobacterium catenulatum]|uniref:single-stranded DNA-binding protein n=1 Tax=Bifidobacterium catenulatum TaxID=1686 RepID=UPI003D3340FC
MAIGETVITIVGNLTADPELRTTSQGAQVAGFAVANTARVYNKQTGQYEDGAALFMRCSAWNGLAQHCAQSLAKGMRVIAQGRLRQHSYQAQDGTNRTVVELQVDEIGPSLRYATAQVSRISHQGGPVYGNPAAQTPTVNTGAGGWSQQPAQSTQPAAPADDPWGAPSDDRSSFGGFGKPDPEPEF